MKQGNTTKCVNCELHLEKASQSKPAPTTETLKVQSKEQKTKSSIPSLRTHLKKSQNSFQSGNHSSNQYSRSSFKSNSDFGTGFIRLLENIQNVTSNAPILTNSQTNPNFENAQIKHKFETIEEESEIQPNAQDSVTREKGISISKYDKTQEQPKLNQAQSNIRLKERSPQLEQILKQPPKTGDNPGNKKTFNNFRQTSSFKRPERDTRGPKHSVSNIYPGFLPQTTSFYPGYQIQPIDSIGSNDPSQTPFRRSSLMSNHQMPDKKTLLNSVIQEEDQKSVSLVSDIKQLYLQQIKDTMENIKKDKTLTAVEKLSKMQTIMKEFNTLIKEI